MLQKECTLSETSCESVCVSFFSKFLQPRNSLLITIGFWGTLVLPNYHRKVLGKIHEQTGWILIDWDKSNFIIKLKKFYDYNYVLIICLYNIEMIDFYHLLLSSAKWLHRVKK